ncbi:hypothetical protein EKO24_016235 [Candidatus Methylobacter oryzae]|uniref:Uncharacterized protein n=1 Tax=Candidatus Methylobacter oryzae TaxID=2497749 RepID=A0ABY3C789_9GAMM|nr:hypothetical protein EKO24_016235 [Candidatus Methylobacter oryzae]
MEDSYWPMLCTLVARLPFAAPSTGEKRQPGRLFFGYFLFDCKDAGGRATQEQLPRRRKRKYLALGCENPIQINCRASDAERIEINLFE